MTAGRGIICYIKNDTGNVITCVDETLRRKGRWAQSPQSPIDDGSDVKAFYANSAGSAITGFSGEVVYEAYDGTLFCIEFKNYIENRNSYIRWNIKKNNAGQGNPMHFTFKAYTDASHMYEKTDDHEDAKEGSFWFVIKDVETSKDPIK